VEASEIATLSRDFDRRLSIQLRTSVFNTVNVANMSSLRELRVAPRRRRLEYADLKRHFAGWSETPSLAQVREAVRKIRASKGMLIVPGDDDSRSAGSFFKNPILSDEQFAEIMKRAAAKNLEVPSYPALEKQRKLSAAWLVEHSGFAKGYGFGQVGISRRHALAIVNRGNATASEVLALKDQIQQRVKDIWALH
jgi:UDP-N-acetylmuramate dehydrogenase